MTFTFWKKQFIFLLVPTLLCTVTACELTDDELDAMDSALALDIGAPTPPNLPENCQTERFTQPEAEVTRKLDILFVTDTSGSLNAERGAVANGIDAFVNALPAEVDYQIAVMLAHGSRGAKSGKIWKYKNDPHVLKSSEHSLSEIRSQLRTKLTNVMTDKHSDGGEEGLYSVNRSLDNGMLDSIRAKGFYREDAALAIVFIADENDICAQYPEGIIPVYDSNKIEPEAKERDCGDITAAGVLARLKAFKGDKPLLVTGIVYMDNSTFSHTGENEIGYGYLDIIKQSNGLAIDLADGHYQEGLEAIGELASIKLNLLTEFVIPEPANGDVIEPSSIQVFIDGAPVPFSFVAETRQVSLTDTIGGPGSTVDINYCYKEVVVGNDMVADICEEGEFVPKASVNLGLSIDPASGVVASMVANFQTLGISPTVYTDAEIAAGKPADDGITILVITRKVVLNPVDQTYIDGIYAYINSGGSVLAEYDGAALFFNSFSGSNSIIGNTSPAIELFTGSISGGGVLFPLEYSRAYVTDPYHPIMEGLPADFLNGMRKAFAVTDYDGEWLQSLASFTSSGYMDQVPAGTYPAILAGPCGSGRVTFFMMNHLTVMTQNPVDRMVDNTLNWAIGQ